MFEKLNPFSSALSLDTSEIVDLRIYPIKSCRGISVKTSYLTKRGLDLDRNWMFVDAESHKFITIRNMSSMTLIDTAIVSEISDEPESKPSEPEEYLRNSIRGTDQVVTIPARPSPAWLSQNTTLDTVEIWENKTDAYIYSSRINNIFSKFLSSSVKLVYKGPTPRILRGNGAPEVLGREESTNFPDVLPLLIVNEGSIRELNKRLGEKGREEISIERFRANVVVRGVDSSVDYGVDGDERYRLPKPWSEDNWKIVRMVNSSINGEKNSTGIAEWLMGGEEKGLEVDVQARCARCQVPNVDPETAVKDKREPWDTLVSYRRVDEGIKFKPCFGMLCVPRNEGRIEIGMRFEVLETTDSHKYIKGF